MIHFLRSQTSWLTHTARRFAFALMVVLTVTSCANALWLAFLKAELFYSYQYTTGPYEVLDDNGAPVPGRLASTVVAGERYGWIVSYCLEHDIGADAELTLVRLAQDGLPEQVVDHRVMHWRAADHRCGPIFGNWRVPEGARPGSYELRRRLVFTEGVALRIHKDLPPVHLTVSAVASPGPITPSRATPAVLKFRQAF